MKYYVHVDEVVRMDTCYLVEAHSPEQAKERVLNGDFEHMVEKEFIELIEQVRVTNVAEA